MHTEPDTRAPRAFPSTRDSLVRAFTSGDPGQRRAGFEALVAAYWRPAYAHLRLRWRLEPADAEDSVQEFFTVALAQEFFGEYDPTQARFRTFLRLCLDRFAAKAHRAEHRLKRGGGAVHLSLDFAGAEQGLEELAPGQSEEHAFDREWVRSLFDGAIEALELECRADGYEIRFEVFKQYDLVTDGEAVRPTYRAIAERLGIPATQVTNHLAWSRRRLRVLLLERLRDLCGSEAEFEDEAIALFGTDRS
jgi:DNA-directed RNA polymerase specialized sigma24 family protein